MYQPRQLAYSIAYATTPHSRADYVSQQMKIETDFLHEAENARKCQEYLLDTPELKDKVYIPRVYADVASTERIMVMEYIEGCKSVLAGLVVQTR